MSKKLRVGIVGTGFGTNVLLQAFRSDKRCEVVALCANNPDHAVKAAREHGIRKTHKDWRKLISDPEIDAVAIAVPSDLQPAIALGALHHKKAVFCEKPVAVKLKDAEALAVAAKHSHVTNVVDLEFPEVPAFLAAKKLIDSKKLGRIRNIVLSWQIETYANKNKVNSWKSDAAKGGGALLSFVSHSFYYLEWLLGPADALNARLRKAEGTPGSAETLCMIRLRFVPGFYANMTVSTHALHGSGHRIEIYGEKGSLRLENAASDHIEGFKLFFGSRKDKAMKPVLLRSTGKSGRDGRIGAVASLAQRFVGAALAGKSTYPDLAAGHRVQVLLDAARRSDDLSGQAVFFEGKS